MTPFEIRLELLKLSRDILSEANHSEIQRLVNDWDSNRETKCQPHPALPKFTSDDVIREAEKLNKFISNS